MANAFTKTTKLAHIVKKLCSIYSLYLMFILYHKEQQLYTSGVAISHPRLATLPDPAPSLKSSQYRMNLPTRNPTVHLTHQGNLKSQSFFSKQNPLHTYVAMYSFSTESHVPRDDRFLFYDPDRYYHFLKKQESHDAKLRKNSTMGVQGSGHNTSLGDAILESADELSERGELTLTPITTMMTTQTKKMQLICRN